MQRSTNGGSNWTALSSGQTSDFYALAFGDTLHGLVVGNYDIVRTTDGGRTWPHVSGPSAGWWGLSMTDADHAVAVGTQGKIARTSDGGATWQERPSGVTSQLNAVHMVTTAEGWAIGGGGSALHTTDSGATWTAQPTGSGQAFYGLRFSSLTDGWAVGSNGTVIHTTNGGTSWSSQTLWNRPLFGIFWSNNMYGIIVGADGCILRTTNLGQTWDTIPSGTTATLRGVWFNHPSTGWVVGAGGTMLRTTDDGRSWFPVRSNTSQFLYNVVMLDTAHGWTTGWDGCIMHGAIAPPGIEETPNAEAREPNIGPTLVRSVLDLPFGICNLTSDVALLDVCGRPVLALHPGPNDVSRLAPGVYFVKEPGVRDTKYVRKVVIQR
jgi:photosystem II stability/assembly factor-like uncharacterized protein